MQNSWVWCASKSSRFRSGHFSTRGRIAVLSAAAAVGLPVLGTAVPALGDIAITYTTVGSSQLFLPQTGQYTFDIAGAQGGSNGPTLAGGGGARIQGTTANFTSRDSLTFYVGGMGSGTSDFTLGAGGGGGSFLFDNSTSSLLLAAGGGGGEGGGVNGLGGQASTTSGSAGGSAGGQTGGAGGTAGSGGQGGTPTGGAAGGEGAVGFPPRGNQPPLATLPPRAAAHSPALPAEPPPSPASPLSPVVMAAEVPLYPAAGVVGVTPAVGAAEAHRVAAVDPSSPPEFPLPASFPI